MAPTRKTVPLLVFCATAEVAAAGLRGLRGEDAADANSIQLGVSPRAATKTKSTWNIVFRQTYPYMYADNEWSKNPDDQTNDNFAILDKLEQYRMDGKFTFRLRWPGSGYQDQVWSQTSNPVTTVEGGVTDYQPLAIPYVEAHWGGLEYSENGRRHPWLGCTAPCSLLDGSVDDSHWFYSVGAKIPWWDGIPGPKVFGDDDSKTNSVQVVELYAQADITHFYNWTNTSGMLGWTTIGYDGYNDSIDIFDNPYHHTYKNTSTYGLGAYPFIFRDLSGPFTGARSPILCSFGIVTFWMKGGKSATDDPYASDYLGVVLVKSDTAEVVRHAEIKQTESWTQWENRMFTDVPEGCYYMELRDGKVGRWGHVAIQSVQFQEAREWTDHAGSCVDESGEAVGTIAKWGIKTQTGCEAVCSASLDCWAFEWCSNCNETLGQVNCSLCPGDGEPGDPYGKAVGGSGLGTNGAGLNYTCTTKHEVHPEEPPFVLPGAVGDPHLVNVRGEKFDVKQPGSYTLLRLPRSHREPTLLKVTAKVEEARDAVCESYFTEATLSGLWLGNGVSAQVRALQKNRTKGGGTQLFSVRLVRPSAPATTDWIPMADFPVEGKSVSDQPGGSRQVTLVPNRAASIKRGDGDVAGAFVFHIGDSNSSFARQPGEGYCSEKVLEKKKNLAQTVCEEKCWKNKACKFYSFSSSQWGTSWCWLSSGCATRDHSGNQTAATYRKRSNFTDAQLSFRQTGTSREYFNINVRGLRALEVAEVGGLLGLDPHSPAAAQDTPRCTADKQARKARELESRKSHPLCERDVQYKVRLVHRLRYNRSSSAEICGARCVNTETCQCFSWSSTSQKCLLMSRCEKAIAGTGFVSGRKGCVAPVEKDVEENNEDNEAAISLVARMDGSTALASWD